MIINWSQNNSVQSSTHLIAVLVRYSWGTWKSISWGLHGVSAHGPPNVGKRLTSELRLRPRVVRSAPRARLTRLGSVSAARMKVRSPIIPNWSTTILAGIFVTSPAWWKLVQDLRKLLKIFRTIWFHKAQIFNCHFPRVSKSWGASSSLALRSRQKSNIIPHTLLTTDVSQLRCFHTNVIHYEACKVMQSMAKRLYNNTDT